MPSADVTAFRLLSVMPKGDVDLLEASADTAGFLDARIAGARATIFAQLRKRYDVTFPSGEPQIVGLWLAQIVTPAAYLKRGGNPSDATLLRIEAERTAAEAQVAQAADAVGGLFDLPLLANKAGTAISKGTPLAYAEQSPYTAKRRQSTDGRKEDDNGR